MLGEHVDKSNLSRFHGETSNAVLLHILPPGDCKGCLVEGRVRLGWGEVEVGPHWTVHRCDVLHGVNEGFGLNAR